MTECIIWILCVYGITNILVVSMLFKPLREFALAKTPFIGKILTCVMCAGFWVGGFLSMLWNPTQFITQLPGLSSLLGGALGSGTSWIIHVFVARAVGKGM